MVETNRLGRLGKQVDDGRAAEAERVLVDNKVLFWSAVQQKQHVEVAHFSLGKKVEQRVGHATTIGIRLIETEIEEEILFRKREVFEQQHVARMDVRRMRQHVVVRFEPNRLD